MSKTKQKDGPWEVHFDHDATGYPVFHIHGMSGAEKDDAKMLSATAQVIETAPDMLEALEVANAALTRHAQWVGTYENPGNGEADAMVAIAGVIAKAKGES